MKRTPRWSLAFAAVGQSACVLLFLAGGQAAAAFVAGVCALAFLAVATRTPKGD